MARRYSDALGVTPEALKKEGAFNGFVVSNANLYIDPHLLASSSAPELSKSYQTFQHYFEDVIDLLVASQAVGDRLYREARSRLHFKELHYFTSGYGCGVLSLGSDIGSWSATIIASVGFEFVKAGVTDPDIFELVGLLEEGIGAGRISDMTVAIIADDLLAFSVRVANNLRIPMTRFLHRDQLYSIPYDRVTGRPVLLVPADILQTLPAAADWSDMDEVQAYSSMQRGFVNATIGKTWKDTTNKKKLSEEELRSILLANPDLIRDLVQQYCEKPAEPYDFAKDPEGIVSWYETAVQWTADHPLALPATGKVSMDQLYDIARTICTQFGTLLETFGLHELLYSDDGGLRKEEYARKLFFGIADSYCRANDVAIDIALNSDGHSVGFKLSQGYKTCIPIFVKYTSNSHLRRIYDDSLVPQGAQNQAVRPLFLVIQTSISDDMVKILQDAQALAIEDKKLAPELICVDGRASHRPKGKRRRVEIMRPVTDTPCREDERKKWYEYKYLSDEGFTGSKFTHINLGEAIGVSAGTSRHYYSEWLAGVDTNEILMLYGCIDL